MAELFIGHSGLMFKQQQKKLKIKQKISNSENNRNNK